MNNELDRHTALRILQSLAESGQPPKLGASHLNQGTEAVLRRLKSDYLDGLLRAYDGRDGAGVCKWAVANYGNGKTQFLRCLQEQAWGLNYATAFVELTQDECPLDRSDRVYTAIARRIQAAPQSSADVDRGHGLDVTLQQLLDRRFPGVLSMGLDPDLQTQAQSWVETSLGATPVESTGFRTAAVMHLLAKLSGDASQAALTATFLRGEPVSAAEMRSVGVHEKLDKSTGFLLLRSLCQLLQRSELAAGTVLLFDEARRSLSLMSSKAQKVACENLLSVINRCNSEELPGTMFVYAVMPEFFTNFATAYPALQQRCGPNTKINLESLQGISEGDLLKRIGDKITAIFRVAHPDATVDGEIAQNNLNIVVTTTLQESQTVGGTRRLFVKTWTDVLQASRDEGWKRRKSN